MFNPTRSAVPPDYKLAFARQMLRYQKESMSSDPDKAGLAMSKAEKLMNTGKNLVRDHELAARISVMLCQWGRAVTLYPETMTAEMVRTQCDTYKDYR